MIIKRKLKKGQAIVETAIMLPLLVMIIVGIGYFGSAITIQHNITVAARHAARSVAIDSTTNPLDRTEGTFFMRLTSENFKKYAQQALPGFDPTRIKVEPVPMTKLPPLQLGRGSSFFPIPASKGFAYLFKKEGKASAVSSSYPENKPVRQLSSINVGVGAIFFGVRLTYRLKELDWMSNFLFKRKEGITLEGISFMPAELPLRGMGYGLMGINEGLYGIVQVDVSKKNIAAQYDYSNLVKEE